ncbi:MAG: hypothetical protein IJ594_05950 [Oscillospiraceae bacterium]|nr:hypothetical protein [Oscillospiraceae bacterium]
MAANEQKENAAGTQSGKKPESKGGFSPLALVALLLLTLAESGESALVSILFAALMTGAIVYVLYKSISRFAKKRQAAGEAAEKTAHRASGSEYAAPDAHCVVCENTGDDHFARDREQRIKQLDDWLANGLIDKEEYRELKARYEEQP